MQTKSQTVVRVGIAVFLLNNKNQFLIGKRVKEQQYQLPGGHLEMFETFEQCASRELQEETNIMIDPKEFKFIATKNVINKEEGRHYVDQVLVVKMPEDQVVINNEIDKVYRFLFFQYKIYEQCEGWEWISCNEILKIEKKEIFDALLEFIKQFSTEEEMLNYLLKSI